MVKCLESKGENVVVPYLNKFGLSCFGSLKTLSAAPIRIRVPFLILLS
ncbi:MAG: hypothetical protein MJZ28_05840 [Paludibacteraceae bacterium]|nr:hypothetical protein [Paludibacteraceae bacterium]